MRTCSLKAARLADIGSLIKACFQFDEGGDRFALFCGFAECFDNRTVA